jgi:hypothetical protein
MVEPSAPDVADPAALPTLVAVVPDAAGHPEREVTVP